jgi:hypothetical protein
MLIISVKMLPKYYHTLSPFIVKGYKQQYTLYVLACFPKVGLCDLHAVCMRAYPPY